MLYLVLLGLRPVTQQLGVPPLNFTGSPGMLIELRPCRPQRKTATSEPIPPRVRAQKSHDDDMLYNHHYDKDNHAVICYYTITIQPWWYLFCYIYIYHISI